MINIDMWYGDNQKRADKIDITFYPNDGEYRGNIYKNEKMIGQYWDLAVCGFQQKTAA